jgi:hypothetical protein
MPVAEGAVIVGRKKRNFYFPFTASTKSPTYFSACNNRTAQSCSVICGGITKELFYEL